MMRLSTLLAAVSLTTIAEAQPVEMPTQMVWIKKAILCDTAEELETHLSMISVNNGAMPDVLHGSCGMFLPEQPVLMAVTPQYWYETPLATVLITKFVYQPNGWEQWGYATFIKNQNYTTESL